MLDSRLTHASLAGFTVMDDDDDDPVLIGPDGKAIDTWREGYPYDERLAPDGYEAQKRQLQIELIKLQNWVKERMFRKTDTKSAPWTVVKSNDKKRARLEAIRHVLDRLDYADKDEDLVGVPDPLVVGAAADLFDVTDPNLG